MDGWDGEKGFRYPFDWNKRRGGGVNGTDTGEDSGLAGA